jgi:hypothetical protein
MFAPVVRRLPNLLVAPSCGTLCMVFLTRAVCFECSTTEEEFERRVAETAQQWSNAAKPPPN